MPIKYKRYCNQCGEYYESQAKYFCSRGCCDRSKIGKKLSDKQKHDLSINRMSIKNPNWKGNYVGKNALHRWVEKRLEKPSLCAHCEKTPPYDLANKGIYNRDLKNWEWLCRRCHMLKDGRMKNLKNQNK